jgi:DNA replication protein DnaC
VLLPSAAVVDWLHAASRVARAYGVIFRALMRASPLDHHRDRRARRDRNVAAAEVLRARRALVIDEIGYLAFDDANADLLFQVITMRYEKKSLVLTTNLAFSEWPSIFPSATSVIALIDRIVHHADVIPIEGKS